MYVGLTFEDAGPNTVLCKTCSVLTLLCVLEQPRVDNSRLGPLKRETLLGAIGAIDSRPTLYMYVCIIFHYKIKTKSAYIVYFILVDIPNRGDIQGVSIHMLPS
jgi:hypothetical protein